MLALKHCTWCSKNRHHNLQCFHVKDATFANIPNFHSSIKWCTVQIMCSMTKWKTLYAQNMTTNSYLLQMSTTNNNVPQTWRNKNDLRLTEIASRCWRVKVECNNWHVSAFQMSINRLLSPEAFNRRQYYIKVTDISSLVDHHQ